jgi:hypothetical protein
LITDAQAFRLINKLKLCLILRAGGNGYCVDYRSGPKYIEVCADDLKQAVVECAAKVESERAKGWA